MKYILLVEPDYKNKYPPLGLMKISTYHKNKGDEVCFVKGISAIVDFRLWDRIYITSLFTFHFNLTVSTIRYYKRLVHNISDIYVGGILASLMPEELKRATGVENIIEGQLESSSKIGFCDQINIDELTPDYDMLDDVDFTYPAGDNYFAYTTRGCPNKCPFCAVPKLEPEFKTTNKISEQIKLIDQSYGPKRNLILLDNNILYSPDLADIVAGIKRAGFLTHPNYFDPSPLSSFVRRIKKRQNREKNYLEAIRYLQEFRKNIKNQELLQKYDKYVNEIESSRMSKKSLVARERKLLEIIYSIRNKTPKQRYVDFNQGIDARLLTQERIEIIRELPIRPLRIAFDSINQKSVYEKAVKLAYKNGFRDFSNYILYNYNDKPEDLWLRFKINLELRDQLGVNIFSFPMKYIPIFEINRDYIGKHWNKKYIRAIQSILLAKKGIVSTNRSFFEKAFGATIDEYYEILAMPEDFIIYRSYYENTEGLAFKWRGIYRSLTDSEHELLIATTKNNKTVLLNNEHYSKKLKEILSFYEITYPAK